MRTVQHSLPYRAEIDGLRGIAILLVVLYHLWPQAFPFGYAGVDVFFVLSGYLITRVITTRRTSGRFRLGEFYRNRIRRIFPAMVLVLATVIAAGWLFLYPSELARLGAHVQSSAFFFQNVRLASEEGYWNEASELKPLLHFWSLSIEEQFYLFWPLLVGLLMTPLLPRVAGLILAVPVVMGLPLLHPGDPFFSSFARFWELAIGGFAASLERFPKVTSAGARLRLAPPALLLLGLALLGNARSFTVVPLVVVTLATAVWLVHIDAHGEPRLRDRVLVFLGLVSFPLYLWHYPILSFMRIFGHPPEEHALAVLSVCVGLAFLTYHFIETFSRRQTSGVYMAFLVLLVLATGLLGWLTSAVADRDLRPWFRELRGGEALLERSPSEDPACRRLVDDLLARKTTFAYCRMTRVDPSASRVAIIGDSHAEVAFPGFATELGARGMSTILLAGSGCPAFVGGAVGRDLTEIDACGRQIDDIHAVLDRLPDLSGVILVARGPKYMTDEGFGEVDRVGQAHLIFRRTLEKGPAFRAADEYLASIDASLRHFQTEGVPAFILLENPELGFSARACLPRPFGIPPVPCSVPRAAYARRMGEYRSRVVALAARFPNVAVLDPEPLFCDATRCTAVIDGALQYLDDDHLSQAGSMRQAQAFVGTIDARVRRSFGSTR